MTRLDDAVMRQVRRRRRSALDAVAVGLAHAGRGGILWIAIAAALRRYGGGDPVRHTAVPVLASYAGSAVLARAIGRERPCREQNDALVDCPDGPSLPSDQAAAAFAGAIALSRSHPDLRSLLYATALAVAGARVYVGVHYPTDIAAGAACGILAARSAGG
jgi:membrane-associated phospholipid phosphatase